MFNALFGNATKVDNQNLNQEFAWLLTQGESFYLGYVLIRDLFIFTNKRLILVDKQGMSGKKMEILSIPYSKITYFSVENAGTFDYDSELKIWLRGSDAPITKSFRKEISIQEVYQVLSEFVL